MEIKMRHYIETIDMFEKQFIIKTESKLANKYPIKPTFYINNKIFKSQIDFFLHKRAEKNIKYTVSINQHFEKLV